MAEQRRFDACAAWRRRLKAAATERIEARSAGYASSSTERLVLG